MPSRWQEPGGIAALEAMSVGTPVSAYANGGLAEYVTGTGGGRAIEPNVSRLVTESHALASSQELWREHSIQARIGVASLHSADRYMTALEGLYRSVLK
jgi:glycosyltransferase involved in cell wall biosynthesis